MGCRSCGLGPSPIKVSAVKPTSNQIITRSISNRPKVENADTTKKTSLPKGSQAKTFPTVGEN